MSEIQVFQILREKVGIFIFLGGIPELLFKFVSLIEH